MTSILRQSRERNCWHAITHLQSLQLRKKILKIGKRNDRIEKKSIRYISVFEMLLYIILTVRYKDIGHLNTSRLHLHFCHFTREASMCSNFFSIILFLTFCFSHNLFYLSDFKPTSYPKFCVLTFTFSTKRKKKKKKKNKVQFHPKCHLRPFCVHMTIWNRNGKMRQRNQ